MKVVIIGNGVAGVTAARTIRERDREARIVIFSDEGYHYYPRPRLIEFLAGAIEEHQLFFYPDEWYRERNIEVHLAAKVTAIDAGRRTVTLGDGHSVDYDRLLLATGGRPNVPPVKGVEQEGVFTLRRLDDALRIKQRAARGARAVVVGGGLLGLESARALQGLGLHVSVLQIGGRLLPAQLDDEGGEMLLRQIEAQDIHVILNAAAASIGGNGSVAGVELEDGRQLEASLVLISAGIRSNVELAKTAGLAVNKGIVADQRLLTSAPDVYAAGDVAEVGNRVYGIIPAAVDQARVAADSILGAQSTPYTGTVPSNTLQVMGIDLTSVGVVNPEAPEYEELRWRDEKSGVYKKVVLQGSRVVGAIVLGDRQSVPAIMRMVREKTDVGRYKDRLLHPDFELKTVFS